MAKDPFATHPSPDNYFGSRSHDQAFQLLMESVKEGEPYILITGEYGAGKTLLCLKLCRFFDSQPDLLAVTVSSPAAPYGLLLRSIAVQLEVTGIANSCKTVAHFEAALFNLYNSGKLQKSVYLVIDDLQDYEPQMLLHFRYLINFHVKDFYPFRLICFSYSGFIDELKKNPQFIPFLQRFRRRLNIQPLQEEELKEYIYFRLLQAGAKGRPIFDDKALLCISDITGRIPRLINNLCDRLLLRALELRADRINVELVQDVCRSDEIERLPHANGERESVGKERIGRDTTKKTGFTINLEAITTNVSDDHEMNDESSSPLAWITRRHLKIGALILAAVILLLSIIFLWDPFQGYDTPSLPKEKKFGYQSPNSNERSGDLITNTTVTTKGIGEGEEPEIHLGNQAQHVSIRENTLNRRITIHQLATADSSNITPTASALPGDGLRPFKAFNSSSSKGIAPKMKRLQDEVPSPLLISEVGSDRIVARWNDSLLSRELCLKTGCPE